MDIPDVSMSPHADLYVLRTKLREILQSVSSFSPSTARPPIIDSSFEVAGSAAKVIQQGDVVKGLKVFKDAVKRDLDVLEKFLANPNRVNLPALSTNAPYLVSVWHEVLMAPPPVLAIWSTFCETGESLNHRRRGLPKEAGVKVDVVADGGKRWIRVNTTKNSRILAEFREIDSYLTDSEGDSTEDPEDQKLSLAQTEFDNSILRMGRSLLAAARGNPMIGTTEVPCVTLRLTRLDPAPSHEQEHDLRVPQTIEGLHNMGIDVQLGERTGAELALRVNEASNPPPHFFPTLKINLDLSILIALVSDLTHSPLPVSVEDAEARFTPSAEYVEWKKKRLLCALHNGSASGSQDDLSADMNSGFDVQPSRALVSQVVQEMSKGLFEEMHDRLSFTAAASPTQFEFSKTHPLEFWTTQEAKDRCLQIVAKIGGPNEKRRAEALFCTDVQRREQAFWRGSRYSQEFVPLFPLQIFPIHAEQNQPKPDPLQPTRLDEGRSLPTFFRALEKTCRYILAQDIMPHPRAAPISEGLDEIQRATVTRANPRLTAHTVQSMLWGATLGWTTLTANKTSVRAILREMRVVRGGLLWNRGDEPEDENSQELPSYSPADSDLLSHENRLAAALWILDPRSLAESMRADFGA